MNRTRVRNSNQESRELVPWFASAIHRRERTAWAAIASPRPSSPTPSFVLPLMLTRAGAMPSASATVRAASRRRNRASFGRSAIDHDVHVADRRIRPRDDRRRARAAGRGSTRPSTAGRCRESAGRCRRRPAAPSIASVDGVAHASASEWPSRPRSNGMVTPPSDRADVPRPGDADRSRCRRAPAALPRPGPPARAIASATGRSSGVVILMFVGSPRPGGRVAGALGERRLVGRVDAGRPAPARREARRAGTPAASARDRSPRAAASRQRIAGVATCRPPSRAASPCRAPAPPPARRRLSAAAAIVRAIRSALANGRAASWMTISRSARSRR